MLADLLAVDASRRSGVVLDAVASGRSHWAREHRRPRALTAREALIALQFEATLVAVAAANVRGGMVLSDEDFARLAIAVKRIDAIADEVAT